MFRSKRKFAGVAKKTRDRGTALFHSRRAGGDLMGSAAGLLSPAWGFAAGDWRTAVAGTTLFAQSVLVAARASLWRSARLGAGMHARHRHRSFVLPFVNVAAVGIIVLLLILALTTMSATQDIAIDSYSVGLITREEEGAANGVRASAYRVALVCAGGGLVFLAAVLQWNSLFILASVIFALLGFAALRIPRQSLPEEARGHWWKGFIGWAGTWRVIPLVLFVLTYKLGEFAIGPMVKPFWVDYGKTIWPVPEELMFQIGLFPTTFGIVLSIVGALIGGAFITRYGIFHGVWFLGLLQAVSNLSYSLVEWFDLGRFGLYGASMFESFSGGLGTAAFLAFLMNVCEKENATVQYAFLSSVFSLTGRLVGGISGLGAERFGYGNYFAITFLLSMPAYLLLPWVKQWIQNETNERQSR